MVEMREDEAYIVDLKFSKPRPIEEKKKKTHMVARKKRTESRIYEAESCEMRVSKEQVS